MWPKQSLFLSTYLKECPLCSGQMEKVSDIAEEMVEEALAQNAEVEHIFLEHEGFRPYGIGALLRFLI
jgi:peptide subunit release factor 1 (eRF1)